jgi:SAM-dependent methyltransferase
MVLFLAGLIAPRRTGRLKVVSSCFGLAVTGFYGRICELRQTRVPTYFRIRNFEKDLRRLGTAIDRLTASPGESRASDPAIAELRLALDSLERRLQFAQEELSQTEARAQLASESSWQLRRRLADTAAKLREYTGRLQKIEHSAVWKIAKPLWKLFRSRRRRRPIRYDNSEFDYAVEWPRDWKTDRPKLLVEGWCFLINGQELAGVRAQIGGMVYIAEYGIERPDLARKAIDCPAARQSGFRVEVPVVLGSSILQLEAIAEGGDWCPFAEREIIRPSTGTIDEVPLPPHRLMVAVAGHDNDEEFRRSRLSGPQQMLYDLAISGIDQARIVDALDFGCGCGRFLAGWLALGTPMRLYGCDYNPELVRWCNANLPGVSVEENQLGRSLPYAAHSFDLVYLLSVMTHLTQREQQQLVSEFRRIVRPGGYVYVTFHGEPFYERLFARVEDGEEQFRRNGFLIGDDDVEGSNECWTLQSAENVVGLFQGFTLIKHFRASERGPTDVGSWQDSMIFQAKAD